MATSEIEKLERRYAENPHGLTFAPLAEVHRKNGDVARALELLTAGLELHPNYIPASIVLGRCHQDRGDLPAAEAAFAHVLRLDDENVIALKSLADINERLERFDDAESWLRRLVTVDRSNEEAREQLRRLEAARNGRPAAGPAPTRAPDTPAAQIQEPSESPTLASPEAVVPDLPSIEIAGQDIVEPAPERQKQAETPPAQTRPAEPWPLILEQPPEVAEQAAAGVPSITDTPDPSRAGPGPIAPLPGLISQEFEAPEGAREFPVEPLEIDVEPSQEVVLEGSGASEFRVPNAAEDFQEAGSAQGTGFFSEFRVPDASEEFREAAEARAAAEAKAAAERRARDEEKAIAAPAEPRVEASSTTAAALDPGPPSYSTRDTKGQSVAAFFRGMLASRPPGDAATPGAPAPEQAAASSPVQDGLSLSSVGQDDSRKADADVSFDDFFGSVSKGSGAEKAADPGKDDLDQFHSWLQNLKR